MFGAGGVWSMAAARWCVIAPKARGSVTPQAALLLGPVTAWCPLLAVSDGS